MGDNPRQGPGDEHERFRAAKDFMNITIVDAPGIKSFFFTLELERAGDRDGLHALVKDYRHAMRRPAGGTRPTCSWGV